RAARFHPTGERAADGNALQLLRQPADVAQLTALGDVEPDEYGCGERQQDAQQRDGGHQWVLPARGDLPPARALGCNVMAVTELGSSPGLLSLFSCPVCGRPKHSVAARRPVGVSPYLIAKRLGRSRENP